MGANVHPLEEAKSPFLQQEIQMTKKKNLEGAKSTCFNDKMELCKQTGQREGNGLFR
jgi:hypothetical protein